MEKLSLIIPCYNEEDSLPYLKEHLDRLINSFPLPIEFIFVDDGSSDQTFSMLNKLFENLEHKLIIKNQNNLDLGGAVKKGIQAVTGQYVAVLDADCSYDPLYLIDMFTELQAGHYDVVSASAHHPKAGFAEHTPAHRVFLSRTVMFMYNLLLWKKQFSYTSIFRLYRTDILKGIEIKSNTFMSMTEIMVKLLLKESKIKEFPAKSQFRKFGSSKARLLRIIKAHLSLMGRIILQKFIPLRNWL